MRLNYIQILAGKRGTGKTTYTLKINKDRKRVLYVMPLDHPAYQQFKVLTLDELRRWRGAGHCRIIVNDAEVAFAAINEHVSNCLICFEDATAYIPTTFPRKVLMAVINCKQRNNDLQFQFHALSRVPVALYEQATYLTIFRTSDTNRVKKVPDYIWPEWEDVRKRAEKNPYYNKTIELN